MIKDNPSSRTGLAIVERYEAAMAYLYPIVQRCPRRHGKLRDALLGVMIDQVGLFYHAAKSRQASRIHAADANLATLRFWLRFAADPSVKIITPNQHRAALRLLAEVGAMLGAWIASQRNG
jgi:hypothetical protein